ncbi:hypothetical protein [Chitinophaga vietnamensis]|nr:hypothetical protein [Chitinophaga vietnamensis]
MNNLFHAKAQSSKAAKVGFARRYKEYFLRAERAFAALLLCASA